MGQGVRKTNCASVHLLDARVGITLSRRATWLIDQGSNHSCATVPDLTPVSPLCFPFRGTSTWKAIF